MKLVRMVGMFCFAAMCAVGLVACGSENRGEVDQGTEIVTRTVVERAEPQGESGEETQTASGSSEESSGESSGEESSSGSSGSEGGGSETGSSTSSGSDGSQEQGSDLVIGDTAVTQAGNEVTVYSYESVAPTDVWQPEPGYEYAAIDVEGCAGEDIEGSAGLNPFDFSLQMPDNTRIESDVGVREPALNDTTLPPGECVRGYVTYQVPEGTVPSSVIFTASSIIEWEIQEVQGSSGGSGGGQYEGSGGTDQGGTDQDGSEATLESAQQAAGDYYRAAGAENWGYTYNHLDSQTQSRFTEDEWYAKNQWYWDNNPTVYHILSVDLDESSGEPVANVEVRITGENGSSFVRNTSFVREGEQWMHRFSQEELNSFMPDASYEEFVQAQGQ